jgi:putative transport protein
MLSGITVSSVYLRLRFFGDTPNAARNILEDMGLVVFVTIISDNAGAALLDQITGIIALRIFAVSVVACTIPPLITWFIGYTLIKSNPVVLTEGVAIARSHSDAAREAERNR